MTESHVTNVLVKKRRELLADLKVANDICMEISESIDRLDSTILLINPDYDLSLVNLRTVRADFWGQRGSLTRAIFRVLWDSVPPLSSRQVSQCILKQNEFCEGNEPDIRALTKSVGRALRDKTGKGVVRYELRDRTKFWELVR